MNRRTIARKPARRAVALALGVAAVTALPLGLTASADATPARAAVSAPRTVVGSPSDSVTRIADFYGAYIDAQSGPGEGGKLAAELRKYYIHPDYLKKLVAWEEKNHADGVLRAQNVPVRWTVTDNGTADHTEADITLTWGSGSTASTTKLVVDMTRDHRIIHIGTKGIGGS
ncbi:hypothetical protein ACOT81_45300 [Streptomyces sp. WI04-05B]|uniref:hypothetical protein n=1 Tax=Streptomyces TaxID=1883 RepID=UPI0029AA530B|nr:MULTISPECIES: hypothetical protein [unclassified Streptomyces]MDX2543475.1 hypothetical protein [Streptomyces sp. WI04-05B]MDX2589144.1 hypothetical protein [Streptomyces sp. WI04-05A]